MNKVLTIIPLFGLILFSGISFPNVYAHGNLDQTTGTCPCTAAAFFGPFTASQSLFQEFVPTLYNIVSIDVELSTYPSTGSPSPNPITVNLRNGDATGPIIGTTTSHTGLPALGNQASVHFDFAGPVVLTPGNLYTIELLVNDGSSQFLWWNLGDTYPSGNSWRLDINNNLNGPNALDLTLKTYYQEQAIGGEIISIDSTSLILAAAQTNLSWIVTAVVVVAGASTFLIRRKNE